MPVIYSYQPASDAYTTYRLLLPEIEDGQPGCIDLGELGGRHYVLVPDGVELPTQPAQVLVTLDEIINPGKGLITGLMASSAILKLMKDRMQGKRRVPRYSLGDELTMQQVYEWLPTILQKNIEDGRAWATKQSDTNKFNDIVP